MSRVGTIILFAMLMIVQTLSIASDVLPSHLGDIHHNSVHAPTSIGDSVDADFSTDEQLDSNPIGVPDNCDGNHCHGSHLLVVMDVLVRLPVAPEKVSTHFIVSSPSSRIYSDIRPPIA